MADTSHTIWFHKSFEMDTVFKFLEGESGLSIVKDMSIKEFLNYRGDTDAKNIDRLFEEYNDEERVEFEELRVNFEATESIGSGIGNLPIKVNTELVLPKDRLNRRVLAIAGRNQLVDQTQFKTFLAKKHEDLLSDPQYQQVTPQKSRYYSITKETHPDISVWLWVRSKSDEKDKEPQGTIINISPFIQTMSISVTGTGGNWQLRLAPVTIKELRQKFGNDFVSENVLHKIGDDENLERSDFLFHNIISTNDLIFIRFESLKSENLKDRNDLSFEISKERLVDNIYDMIGLVDNNVISMNASNSDVSIDVTGRDLMKLLIDDGSYFFAIQFATDPFLNIQDNRKLIGRLVGDGKFKTFYSFRSIRRTLQFIMNHLSHMGVVPDNLFDAYVGSDPPMTDRRVRVFRIDDDRANEFLDRQLEHQKKIKEQKVEAITAIIKQRENEDLPDLGPEVINEELESIFQRLVDFLSTAHDFITPLAKSGLQFKQMGGKEVIIGWKKFTFGGAEVKKDMFPEEFRGKFLPDCITTYPFREELRLLKEEKLRKKAFDPSVVPLSIDKFQAVEDIYRSTEGLAGENVIILEGEAIRLHRKLEALKKVVDSINQRAGKRGNFTKSELEVLVDTKKKGRQLLKEAKIVKKDLEKWKVERDLLRKNIKTSDLTPEELDERIVEFEKKQNLSKKDCPPIPLNRADKVIQEVWKYLKWSEQEFEPPIEEELANGVWQIINLVIDENVTDRRLSDDSISQPDGSLLNHFHKACQEPLAEFFTDTYGDQFFFIARQPPFTGKAIKEFIGQNLVLDVEEEDVIFDSLGFNEEGVYSWYQITPQGAILGDSRRTVIETIPAVYFPEYADVWGSRKFEFVTSYITYKGLVHADEGEEGRYLLNQVVSDFKYVIDIHAYLPFTRRGTLTINGDRRIKRGTWIRYKSTNEIYYVDAVSNSYSISNATIDRVTTLQVSRGMKEEFIEGKEVVINGKKVVVSYFNIINTDFIKDQIIERLKLGADEEQDKIDLERLEKELKEKGIELQKRAKVINGEEITERKILENKIAGLKSIAEQQLKAEQENTFFGEKKIRSIVVKQDFGVNEDIFNFFLRRQQFKK